MKVFQNNQWVGSRYTKLSFSFDYYFSKSHGFKRMASDDYKREFLKTLNLKYDN